MKTNKIYLKHFICISFILQALTSCQTDKLLNRRKNKIQIAEQKKILMNREQQALLNNSRMISLSDSSDQSYQISILPIDSFSFSIRDGFKGKAASIKINGKQRVLKTISDSSAQYMESHHSEKADMISRYKQEQNMDLKVKEKESRTAVSKIMLILPGLLILVVGWRYLRGFRFSS